jgi:hypothetical protein
MYIYVYMSDKRSTEREICIYIYIYIYNGMSALRVLLYHKLGIYMWLYMCYYRQFIYIFMLIVSMEDMNVGEIYCIYTYINICKHVYAYI